MGRELCETFHLPTNDDLFPKIWSAAALVKPDWHDTVVAAHKSYIDAGSTLLSTNSFGTQPTFYARAFPDGEWQQRMLADAELSAKLAVRAREEAAASAEAAGSGTSSCGKSCSSNSISCTAAKAKSIREDVKVMGALGSLLESHRPDAFVKAVAEKGEEWIAHWYEKLAEALIRGGADYILLETINCWEEAALGLEGISRIPNAPPSIVSLEGAFRGVSLKPHPTKSAHSFRALWPRIKTAPSENPVPIVTEDEHMQQYENKFNLLDPRHAKLVHKENPKPVHVACIGFNCAPPEEILIALRALKEDAALDGSIKANGIRLCAYANVNDRKDAHDNGFDVRKDKHSAIKKRSDLVAARPSKSDDAGTGGKVPSYSYGGYVDFVHEMVEGGVDVIGGCCGCGPEGIEELGMAFQPTRKW
eukprot:g17453.t1